MHTSSLSSSRQSLEIGKKSSKHNRLMQRMLRVEARDSMPITLRHERIYILPTHRGLAFFGVVVVMLIASMNFGLNLGYALSFILIGLFASCLLSTYLNLAQLQFISAHARDCHAGSPQSFSITLREAKKRTRYSLTVSTNAATSESIDINAGSDTTAALQSATRERGVHTLGRLTVSSNYPLGLWRGWGYVHAEVSSYVYPRAEKPQPPFATVEAESGEMNKKTTLEREFVDLKPYQNTDSPGAVAWKSVARGAGWYSKRFDAEERSLDLAIRWQDTPQEFTTEQKLSRMCAWVIAAEKGSVPYSFELPPLTRAAGSGRDHCQQCLRDLASYTSAQGDIRV